MIYKTGLLPSPEPPALQLRTYLLPQHLPAVPAVFGHQNAYPWNAWGMLANDKVGDCAVAGAMHCCMLWNKTHGRDIFFTDRDARGDYYTITGGEDTGMDMVTAARFWRNSGFRDSQANRHKIAAYMAVDPKNLEHVYTAAYLFDAVGLGVKITSGAESQFFYGHPWANVPGDKVIAYHYVPLIGRVANGNAIVVTWGRAQEVEQSWLGANLQECIAMVSEEDLMLGKSEEGFDISALLDDLGMIGE